MDELVLETSQLILLDVYCLAGFGYFGAAK